MRVQSRPGSRAIKTQRVLASPHSRSTLQAVQINTFIMPPKRSARKTGRGKAATSRPTTRRSPSSRSSEGQPDQAQVAEPPEPVPGSCRCPHSASVDDGEQQKSLKKSKTHTHLTPEQEEAMVEWLKANEVLYNKKLEAYKDTKKKNFLWQKQAEVMGVNSEELIIWYTSLRTRYTKLRKKKSGDGAPELTERDQWLLDNFSFLSPFTYEVRKSTLVSVSTSYNYYINITI